MNKTLSPTYLPAIKGRIGMWAFYTTIMKFSEVAERIQLSDEIYKNKRLSDMVQRSVRSDREKAIASYLQQEPERFFPAMVVAVFEGEPNWLEFSIQGRNTKLNLDLSSLDVSKLHSFGFLSLTGEEKLFPLDGQHRLAGIRKALEDSKRKENFLGDDEVTVMLVGHEPNEQGRMRSRRLFTVLNKRAVSVKTHETIALDEDDVMAIATRYLVERFDPLTRDGIVSFRTNANIPSNDHKPFTTIVTLYAMLLDLFRAISKRKIEDLKYHRPDDEWIEVYLACAKHFFSLLIATFPEVKSCLESNRPSGIIAKHRRYDGGHILFRPIGQNFLAQLVSESIRLTFKEKFEDAKGVSPIIAREMAEKALTDSFTRYAQIPTDLSKKPYVNLIWDSGTQKMQVKRAAILRDIVLKRYGIIRPSVEHKLENRLQESVGPNVSTKDFIW